VAEADPAAPSRLPRAIARRPWRSELARLDAEATEARRRLLKRGQSREGERESWRRSSSASSAGGAARRRQPVSEGRSTSGKRSTSAELRTQRADLEQSLAELDNLRRELCRSRSSVGFAETYAAVERNFAEVAGTLFPGGEGRLRSDRDDESEDGGRRIEVARRREAESRGSRCSRAARSYRRDLVAVRAFHWRGRRAIVRCWTRLSRPLLARRRRTARSRPRLRATGCSSTAAQMSSVAHATQKRR